MDIKLSSSPRLAYLEKEIRKIQSEISSILSDEGAKLKQEYEGKLAKINCHLGWNVGIIWSIGYIQGYDGKMGLSMKIGPTRKNTKYFNESHLKHITILSDEELATFIRQQELNNKINQKGQP